jgi:CRP-like cAMP-binding protein
MNSVLENHLKAKLENLQNLEFVLQHFKKIKVKKHTYLLEVNEICQTLYFIEKGALQVFTLDQNHNQQTRDILTEENWCTEINSFTNQIESKENIRTIETCELLTLSREDFFKLNQSIPEFKEIYQKILEKTYINSVFRINSFMTWDALTKINWLINNKKDWLNRFPSKLLASYLGISPETLSRLKSKS